MADFNELLETLRNPGEDGPPESIYDDISGVYNHDIETRDAKISESEQKIMDNASEISKLKSANYDLMMKSAAQDDATENSSVEDDSEPQGIDSLFEDER